MAFFVVRGGLMTLVMVHTGARRVRYTCEAIGLRGGVCRDCAREIGHDQLIVRSVDQHCRVCAVEMNGGVELYTWREKMGLHKYM